MPYSKKWIEANPERFVQNNRARVMRYRKTDKGKFYALRELAKRRSIENTLTMEQFLALMKGPDCYWCGGEVPDTRAGFDRVDNDAGYTFQNCVRCCWSCNIMKAQMSESKFILQCEKILIAARARRQNGAA